MSSIHAKAKGDVTITFGDFRDAAKDPSFKVDDAPDGYSALAWATKKGNLTNMRRLIGKGANRSGRYQGQYILHMAVTAEKNALRAVECILEDPNVDRNAQDERPPNDTPLMTALRNQADPTIIDALKRAGASDTVKNSKGETAQDIANGLTSPDSGDALLDKDEQGTVGPALMRFIVAAVLLLFAYLRPWKTLKDAITAAFKQINKELAKPSPTDKPSKPKLPGSFQEVIDAIKDLIGDLGMEGTFPPDSGLIEDIADKAWENQQDPNTAIKDPDEFKELLRCALYQPILYCDDSGSMKGNRWTAQTDIVGDIATLMSTFAPDDQGVYLRFLNKTETGTGLDLLKGDDIRAKLNFEPDGSTPLGTSLNSKVLTPFVYNPLEQGIEIERPILIITITDGEPNTEDVNTFQNAIVTCSQKTTSYQRPPNFVRFLVNQVGDDAKAAEFVDGLQGISQQPSYKGLLHVTSDKLDTKYYELRKNKRELNAWLFKTILPPRPIKTTP